MDEKTQNRRGKKRKRRRAQTVALYRIALSRMNQIFLRLFPYLSRCVFSSRACTIHGRRHIHKAHPYLTHTHTRAKHSQIGFMVFNASQKQTKQIDKRAHTAQTLSFFHSSASAASTELERRNARWAIECVTSHKSQHSDSAPSTRK